MSGAATARNVILKALKDTYTQVHRAGRDYANAYQQAVTRDDLVEAMGAMVAAIIAAEALQEAAAEAVKMTRLELAHTMAETGATQIASGSFSAHLARKPAVLDIDDSKAIPKAYLIQPDPVPDRKAIKEAIAAGTAVPGARIIIPNELSLVIRSARK